MKSTHKKKYEVYEHLEHYVRKTTYTHRLQWLKEMNDFVCLLKKKKIIPVRPK
jgi:hypothetical protein